MRGRFLIDTNVLIYASLSGDSRAEIARSTIEIGRRANCEAFVSVQNLAEMYPNLTGPKTDPPDTPAEASEKIRRLAVLPYVQILPVTFAAVQLALVLTDRYQVRRQKYFDMQLAATLLLNDVATIVTENEVDFTAIPDIRVVNPFS